MVYVQSPKNITQIYLRWGTLSPFNPYTDVRCMRLWLECFPYLQGCLQVSGKYLVAGITLNQLKGRQMVIYMVWMVEYRR